jgi:hypothetical protein
MLNCVQPFVALDGPPMAANSGSMPKLIPFGWPNKM